MTDAEILSIFSTKTGVINSNRLQPYFLDKHPEIVEYMNNRFPDSLSITETFYRIKHGIEKRPVCEVCGKPVKFVNASKLFRRFCCNRCTTRYIQTPEIVRKRADTWKEIYGIGGEKHAEIKEKEWATNLGRYGSRSPLSNPEVKERLQKKWREKFGVDNVFQSPEIREKIKSTFRERYGADWYIQTEEFKEKSKESCLKRFGVDNNLKSKEIQERIWETKKKNSTYNTSKIEERVYQWLLEEFSDEDIIRQYKEERYPWRCDFYIKSLDLFLEINGNWTHGPHPFDENNPEDLERLNLWKSKGETSKYYVAAIKVWTIADVKKRNTAKENNLKYLEVFENLISKEELLYKIKKSSE